MLTLLPNAVAALQSSPFGRRLVSNTLWSVVAESSSKGLLLVAMVAVARILGVEGYGELGVVRTTLNMFVIVGGMGLGFTANRYVARFRDSDKRYSGQIVGSSYVLAAGFGGLIGCGVIAAADLLARTAFGAHQLVGPLRIAGVLVFLSSVSGAQVGILQGLEAFSRLAIGGLLQGLGGLVCFVLGARYFGLEGALAAFLIYSGGGVLIYHTLIRRELARQAIKPSYRQIGAVLPVLWSFSIPAALMGVAVAPFKWLSEARLARESGFGELGLFHASMTSATIFLALISTLNSPLISITANQQTSQPSGRLSYVNLYASWYLFLLLSAPLFLFPGLTSLLFGGEFAGSRLQVTSLLLLVYCGLLTYYQGIMRLVALAGSLWFGLFTNLCEGLALLAVFYALSSRGALGLSVAYVASYLVRIIVTSPFLVREKIVPVKLLFDKYFILSLAAVFAVALLQIWRLQ